MDCNKQAEIFLKKTKTKLKISYSDTNFYFADDKQRRNIYLVLLERGKDQYYFRYGDSIANTDSGIDPTTYDVLSCLVKHDPGSLDDFLSEFGLLNTRENLSLYQKVKNEWINVERIFHDVMEEFQEII